VEQRKKLVEAVRHHHECWDGSGYPDGLRGENIPLLARVLAVADAFSALTTDRPYRRGANPEQAITILQAGAGQQWDSDCVQAFVQVVENSRVRALAALGMLNHESEED
jgi:HD-GYP domain-containing protein (c-di-GMP phosphodiesterase class II)